MWCVFVYACICMVCVAGGDLNCLKFNFSHGRILKKNIMLYKQKAPLKKKNLRDSCPAIPFYLFSRAKFKNVKIRV